jgi:hypothetical protein
VHLGEMPTNMWKMHILKKIIDCFPHNHVFVSALSIRLTPGLQSLRPRMNSFKLAFFLSRPLGLTLNPPCQAQPKKPANVGINTQGLCDAFFAQIQRPKAPKSVFSANGEIGATVLETPRHAADVHGYEGSDAARFFNVTNNPET